MFCTARSRSVPTVALAAAFALLLAGCGGGDSIRSYRVPKEATGHSRPDAAGEYRLLGLMVPADDPVWYFKLNGTADDLAPHESGFEALAKSVKLSPDQTATPGFTLPEGWKRGGPRGGFVPVAETIKLPDSDLEITITQSGGGLEANLGRWVGMIGLNSGPTDAATYTRVIDAGGTPVRLIDLTGPKNPATSRGPMMGGR